MKHCIFGIEEKSVKCLLSVLMVTMAMVLVTNEFSHAQVSLPNEAGVSFGHVHLNVSDVEYQAELWSELFDGTVRQREGFTAVEIPGILVFLRERESSGPTTQTVMDHLALSVRDLPEILQRWERLGLEEAQTYGSDDRIVTAFITIPGGVRIELYEDRDQEPSVKMDHLHIMTEDSEDLANWYSNLFGAEPLEEGRTGILAPIPGTSIFLSENTEGRQGTIGSVVDHIGFEVEDLNAFAEWVREQGIEFDSEPRYLESIDLWLAFLTDPSGVYIELTEGLDDF